MIVLGISPLDKDATVTLMVDGRIDQAIAEERLSRRKMHSGFPHQALAMVMQRAGITAKDVDRVAYAFLDWQKEAELMNRHRQSDWRFNRSPSPRKTSHLIAEAQRKMKPRTVDIPGLKNPLEKMEKPWHKRAFYRMAAGDGLMGDLVNHWQLRKWLQSATEDHHKFQDELLAGLREFGLQDKLTRVEHHQSHVANAFYCSGFDRALVLTVDAYGSGLSGTVSVADESGIRRVGEIVTPYSLGTMYEYVTSALGFSPDRHAGKIVGLAAYGDSSVLGDVLRNQFEERNGGFRIRHSSDVYLARHLSTLFPKIDLAAAYQTVLEEVVQRQVAHYIKQTGLFTVVLSGGVAANVKMNQRIHDVPGVRNIYVHPNMGDGGCGTGAAILTLLEQGIRPQRLDDVFLGPDYSEEEIVAELKRAGVEYTRHENIEEEVARLIAENNVVARFDGRMEYGPRALGNRSILYPAQDPDVNQWLNTRLGRTEFMPFAPATLYEDRHRCYKNIEGADFAAQFMTVTFDCTPWMREKCPAAVHVDGTARPQLVTPQSSPGFHRILQAYKQLTGIPSVINTSFNMHEEPIVCTPHDALRAFQLGRLDYLALGKFLVRADSSQDRAAPQKAQVAKSRG